MEVESEEFIIPAKATKSLVWQGATLVDWVSGGTRFELDGTVHRPRMLYDYRFDAALASPSGTFVSIFEKLGTKALLVRTSDGSLVRELNRSYYCAESYEYPITFVTLPDGTEALAHCPREYCRIDIEVAETGRCLTDEGSRKPSDVFHSRLQQSPGRTWLASAGWVGHPFDVACVWDLNAILQDPTVLDRPQVSLATDEEVGGLAFLSDDRLLGATGEESWSDEKKPNRLVMFDPATGAVLREVSLSGPGGTIHRLDEHLVLGLFDILANTSFRRHSRSRMVAPSNRRAEFQHHSSSRCDPRVCSASTRTNVCRCRRRKDYRGADQAANTRSVVIGSSFRRLSR
ncbi:MAG: hypothetical protein U1G05_10270 [Kiritimatiellia bacterium]